MTGQLCEAFRLTDVWLFIPEVRGFLESLSTFEHNDDRPAVL